MSNSFSYRTRLVRTLAIFVVIAGLLASLGTGMTARVEGTRHVVYYGADRGFILHPNANELNFADSSELCTSGAVCAFSLTDGDLWANAHVLDTETTRSGATLMGIAWELRKACSGQVLQPKLDVVYGYTATLTSPRSTLGITSATATVTLRGQSTSEAGTQVEIAQDNQQVSTTIERTLQLVPAVGNYTSTVAAGASATVSRDLPATTEQATANASVHLNSMAVKFGDDTLPTSTSTLDRSDGADRSTATGFSGWFKHLPNLVVTYEDPMVRIVDGQPTTIPHSCVDYIEIENDGVAFDVLDGKWDQSAWTRLIDEPGRHNLTVRAVDGNGNEQGVAGKVSLGIDTAAPVTSVVLNRTENGRENGLGGFWYKGPLSAWPAYELTCDDTNKIGRAHV